MGNFDKKGISCMEILEIGEPRVEIPVARYEELIRAETERDILEGVYNNGAGLNRIASIFTAIEEARRRVMVTRVTGK